MNERRARDVTWLEAFESAQPPSRAGATTTAPGPIASRSRRSRRGDGAGDEFVAQRASHALQRLGAARADARRSAWRGARWRPAAGSSSIALIAFALGIAADAIGSSQRINLLAPPLWGVLAVERRWSTCAAARLAAGAPGAARAACAPGRSCSRDARRCCASASGCRALSAGGSASAARALRRALARAQRARLRAARRDRAARRRRRARARPRSPACTRAASCSTTAPAGKAPSSTPAPAHALVTTVLGAGGALSRASRCPTPPRSRPCASFTAAQRRRRAGGAVDPPDRPDAAAASSSCRARCSRSPAAVAAARRSRRFALPLDEPYFQRLLRLQRRRRGARRRSIPYAATPTPQATLGLRALLAASARARGSTCAIAPAVAFGAEDDAAPRLDAGAHARDRAVRPRRDARGREPGALRRTRSRAAAADRSHARRGRRRGGVRAPLRRRSAAALGRAARGVARLGRGARHRRRSSSTSTRPTSRRRAGAAGARSRQRRRDAATRMSDADPHRISLSLVSHTNAGKTTLARTLLGRDIGEVRDAPHVTEFADVHDAARDRRTASGCCFGTRRASATACAWRSGCAAAAQPLGWFLSEVWDRWRDRPFWASQQALRNVRDEADVMLYLVNASRVARGGRLRRARDGAARLGRQAGRSCCSTSSARRAPAALEAAELARWRRHLRRVRASCARCCRSMPSRAAGCRS